MKGLGTGEGEGGEEEGWHHTSVIQLLVQVDSLTATSLTQLLTEGRSLPFGSQCGKVSHHRPIQTV